jgi:maltose O-acetyltransferase
MSSVVIMPSFYCDYGENIKFGKNVFVNYNCVFLDCNEIEIGDNVFIAPGVQLYTALHPINPEQRNTLTESARKIKIGANCWIGGGSIILPGVEIGEGTTIGAGSVVTKNIAPRVVACGNPCTVIRETV